MRNVYLIAVMNEVGKRLRIGVFFIDKNLDAVAKFTAPGEKLRFELRILFNHLVKALADSTAMDINPVYTVNESLHYRRDINFYSHVISNSIISLRCGDG